MSEQNPAGGGTVEDLIRLREQLSGWLSRLDEVGTQASGRVADRVRADYVDRLRRVNEDLAGHRGDIEADLESYRAAMAEAEQERARAVEELDEQQLRHMIGELDGAAWGQLQPSLEGRVGAADDALERARAEVTRLESLAADIAAAAAPPPAETAEAEAPAEAEPEEEWEPVIEAAPEPEPEPEPPAAEAEPEPEALPADEPTQEPEDVTADAPASPGEVAEAAEAADGWDPFGNEFTPEQEQGDAEEDLPW